MSADLKAIWKKAQTGERAVALRELGQLLRTDSENVPAWLMMAALVEESAQKAECCRRVLRLDPENAQAQAWLQQLQPAALPDPFDEPVPEPKLEPKPKRASSVSAPQKIPLTTAVSLTCPNCNAAMDARPGPPPHGFCGYCGTEVDLTKIVAGALLPQALAEAVVPAGTFHAAREQQRAEEAALIEFIIAELSQHASSDAVAEQICHQTGWAWPQAQKFVRRVETTYEGEITRKQTPFALAFAAVSGIVGIGTLVLTIYLFLLAGWRRLDLLAMMFSFGLSTFVGAIVGAVKAWRKRKETNEDW